MNTQKFTGTSLNVVLSPICFAHTSLVMSKFPSNIKSSHSLYAFLHFPWVSAFFNQHNNDVMVQDLEPPFWFQLWTNFSGLKTQLSVI